MLTNTLYIKPMLQRFKNSRYGTLNYWILLNQGTYFFVGTMHTQWAPLKYLYIVIATVQMVRLNDDHLSLYDTTHSTACCVLRFTSVTEAQRLTEWHSGVTVCVPPGLMYSVTVCGSRNNLLCYRNSFGAF